MAEYNSGLVTYRKKKGKATTRLVHGVDEPPIVPSIIEDWRAELAVKKLDGTKDILVSIGWSFDWYFLRHFNFDLLGDSIAESYNSVLRRNVMTKSSLIEMASGISSYSRRKFDKTQT